MMEEIRKIIKHRYIKEWYILRQKPDGEFHAKGKIYREREIINFYQGAKNGFLQDNRENPLKINMIFEPASLEDEIKKFIEDRKNNKSVESGLTEQQ